MSLSNYGNIFQKYRGVFYSPPFFYVFWVGIVVIAGVVSFLRTTIEAFSDVTNIQIIIVTEWSGRSAEETVGNYYWWFGYSNGANFINFSNNLLVCK